MRTETTWIGPALVMATALAGASQGADEVWIHPRCGKLALEKFGPFIELEGGRLTAFDGGAVWASDDDGKSWSKIDAFPARPANQGRPSGRGTLIRTRKGTIVVIYQASVKWGWDDEKREPVEGARMELWVVRSLDGGKTWTEPRKVFDHDSEPVADLETMDIIQTRSGHIVLPFQTVLRHPGRWACRAYVSADDGKSWDRSNLIDLRGAGNHGGAIEPTVVELSDERILMLIRTNLDRFWEAYSSDHGLSWRAIRPSRIDASSAPGFLTRLRSGRLMLAWNRLYPEGENEYPRREANTPVTEYPASWHRTELSIAFSEDDGKTWTKPVVILRNRRGVAYPFILERMNGDIWLTVRFPTKAAVSLREADFAGQ